MRNRKATTSSKKQTKVYRKICNQSTPTWLCNGQYYLIIMMQRRKLRLVLYVIQTLLLLSPVLSALKVESGSL